MELCARPPRKSQGRRAVARPVEPRARAHVSPQRAVSHGNPQFNPSASSWEIGDFTVLFWLLVKEEQDASSSAEPTAYNLIATLNEGPPERGGECPRRRYRRKLTLVTVM